MIVVIYRTHAGRTIYRHMPDHVESLEILIRGDSELSIMENDPIKEAEVKEVTPEQYDAIPDANPTWIELVPSEASD